MRPNFHAQPSGLLCSALAPWLQGNYSPLSRRPVLHATSLLAPQSLQVTAPPSGGEFESVSNYGSGTVVLGPGLNTSNLRVSAERVGQVNAINITANSLTFSGSG